jgi:hypothetical protein
VSRNEESFPTETKSGCASDPPGVPASRSCPIWAGAQTAPPRLRGPCPCTLPLHGEPSRGSRLPAKGAVVGDAPWLGSGAVPRGRSLRPS